MKSIEKTHWLFYPGWIFSGMISLVITFPFTRMLDVFVIDEIIGQTIVMKGEVRITEDYLFGYTFIPLYGIVIGILQYLVLRQEFARTGWWILTTTFGWSLAWLGIALRYSPLGDIEIPSSVEYALMAGAALGLLTGIAQWWVLRAQISHAGWWIPANVLGFGISGVIFGDISNLFDVLLAITIPSVITGIVLWLLLRKLHQCSNSKSTSITA